MMELARRAAREAGEILRQRPTLQVAEKGAPLDLVTQVDLASEAVIREILAASGVPVLAEEGGGAEGLRTRWIVDPLDGTMNFVHGFPFYAVSIALEWEGELRLGVIYDPVRDELFEAERGAGARLNGQPIAVSQRAPLRQALVGSGFPSRDRVEKAAWYLGFVQAMLEQAHGFRRAGAASLDLAMVACGRLDGFWEFGLAPWDVAAGTLIVREAGGRVGDIDGGPLIIDKPRILATNGHIFEEMSARLKACGL